MVPQGVAFLSDLSHARALDGDLSSTVARSDVVLREALGVLARSLIYLCLMSISMGTMLSSVSRERYPLVLEGIYNSNVLGSPESLCTRPG